MNRILTTIAAAAVLVAGGVYLSTPSAPTLPGLAAYAQDAEIDTSTIVEMTLGAEEAPVTVIEYASYTCPHCANFHADTFKKLKADYIDTGKIKFVYREVYFDRYGLWASMVARCGGEMRFFGISDIIYAEQRDWTASNDPATIAEELRTIGKKAGLDDAALDACMTDGTKAQTLVAWYQENAERDEITSTPSFLIDGEKYTNMSYEEFQRILDDKLAG